MVEEANTAEATFSLYIFRFLFIVNYSHFLSYLCFLFNYLWFGVLMVDLFSLSLSLALSLAAILHLSL